MHLKICTHELNIYRFYSILFSIVKSYYHFLFLLFSSVSAAPLSIEYIQINIVAKIGLENNSKNSNRPTLLAAAATSAIKYDSFYGCIQTIRTKFNQHV